MTLETKMKRSRFAEIFITRLEKLLEKGDRGALAILRRALGREVPFETYRFMPFKPSPWEENAALIIGPLFACWHQGEEKPKNAGEDENFGASMLSLVNALSREGADRADAMKRVERRFGALLTCHVDDLKPHLRHAVSLLKSKEVPINWRLLLEDVQQWSHEDRWVQRKWARSFWTPKTESSEKLEEDVASGIDEETGANGDTE